MLISVVSEHHDMFLYFSCYYLWCLAGWSASTLTDISIKPDGICYQQLPFSPCSAEILEQGEKFYSILSIVVSNFGSAVQIKFLKTEIDDSS